MNEWQHQVQLFKLWEHCGNDQSVRSYTVYSYPVELTEQGKMNQ